MIQVKYCYTVKEDNIQVHTSKLFDTPQEALNCFINCDYPAHYAGMKFYRSEFGSLLRNSKTGAAWHRSGVHVEVEFKEVVMNPLTLQDWREVIGDVYPKITE